MGLGYADNVGIDGAGNPYPGGEAGYESQLVALLDRIKATQTGTTLLGFFRLRNHTAWFVPVSGNMSRAGVGGASSSLRLTTRRGAPLFTGSGTRVHVGQFGRGVGADSVIDFQLELWNYPPSAFQGPEQVIVHELFHAMRQTFGAIRNTPLEGFMTVEELYAVFVENMFLNETGRPLRGNYHPGGAGTSPDHAMAHNPSFHAPMRDLTAMMPTIVHALAQVATDYNPFRDWLAFARTTP